VSTTPVRYVDVRDGCVESLTIVSHKSGVDNASLYTQPEDILEIHNALSPISQAFSIAAGFGNVHGVYKPGNVQLQPELLAKHQKYAHEQLKSENPLPIYLVFHGGSGSTKEEIKTAVENGVVKMNVDTDCQWAYMEGHRNYFLKNQDYLKSQVGNPDGADKPVSSNSPSLDLTRVICETDEIFFFFTFSFLPSLPSPSLPFTSFVSTTEQEVR